MATDFSGHLDPDVQTNTLLKTRILSSCFQNISAYRASMAHKTNHSFIPNTEFVVFDHPRWGVIPCLASIHVIQENEEIFVKYGYDLDFCPDWYLAAREQGTHSEHLFWKKPQKAKLPISRELSGARFDEGGV